VQIEDLTQSGDTLIQARTEKEPGIYEWTLATISGKATYLDLSLLIRPFVLASKVKDDG
jgi:hypothetical protein